MGLLGGASALALLGGQASAAAPVDETPGLAPARSFAELLDPIPNATSVLRAEDERALADASGDESQMAVAQFQHHQIITTIITTTTTIITTTGGIIIITGTGIIIIIIGHTLHTPSIDGLQSRARWVAIDRRRASRAIASCIRMESSSRGAIGCPKGRPSIDGLSRRGDPEPQNTLRSLDCFPPGIDPGVAMTRWFNPNAIRPCARG